MQAIPKTVQLYPKQKAFKNSSKLFRAFCGGIGSGKSWIGAYDLMQRSKPGRLYMVVAPTYNLMSDSSFRSFEKIAREFGIISSLARGNAPYIKLTTGAEILFRSGDDPETLRGPNLSGTWLDETSLMKKDVYDIMIGRLREGGELGWLSATFTPKGKAHWTYKTFAERKNEYTEMFHARTDENPFLPAGFVETRRSEYSKQQADQELGGIFLDGAGNHFMPGMWPTYIQIDDAGTLSIPGQPRRIYMRSDYTVILGLDWAMGKKRKEKTKKQEFLDDDGMKGDFTAFVVAALTHDGKLFILEVVNKRVKLEENAPLLAALCRKHKPYIVAGDDDMLSSTMLLDCRRHKDIPEIKCLEIRGKDKLTRAQAAIIHGENGRIYLPRETPKYEYPWVEMFVDQLSSFTGIDDEHDDMVDGLGIVGRLADQLKGDGRKHAEPEVFSYAPDRFGW